VKNPDQFQRVEVQSSSALHSWLEKNHQQEESVWLVSYKKIVEHKYVSREEVLDELIAFGWIDGVRSQLDDERTMQLISPRKTRPWAKSYKERAEKLISEGRMHPAGQADVDKAKQNGGWDEMNDVDELIVPPDMILAFSSRGKAMENFENFPPSVRRNILRWIASAKTPETRQKRIITASMDAELNKRTASHS